MAKAGIWMFSASSPHSDDMGRAVQDLDNQSDRAAALIGATIVELALSEATIGMMHSHQSVSTRLFSVGGPIGDLGAKIDLALLMGVISEETHKEFSTIRKIRNQFAHRLSVTDFKSDSVRDLCANLKIGETRTRKAEPGDKDAIGWPWEGVWMSLAEREAILADPRERFMLTIQLLVHGLLNTPVGSVPAPYF